MGESAADPDAPTQLGEAEPETQSVRAWGLDEDLDDVETQRLATPGRITAVAVMVSLLLVGAAAVIGYDRLGRGDAGPATPTALVPAGVPSKLPLPPPAPAQPALNGLYRAWHDWANTTIRNNERPDGGTNSSEHRGEPDETWVAFSSSCTRTECLATGTTVDQRGRTLSDEAPIVMRFVNGEWENVSVFRYQSECTDRHTGEVFGKSWLNQTLTYQPRPDGSLTGAMTTTVEPGGECGGDGFVTVTPLVLTRIGDAP